MKKNVFMAAFVAATLAGSLQAVGMVEQTDVVSISRKGTCEAVKGSDVMDATIFGKSNVSVSIQLLEKYASGQMKNISGTPVLVFSNNADAFKAEQYQILKGVQGKFAVAKAGFFRVIPAEIQTVNYPQGVLSYDVVQIKVCAQ